MNWNQSFLYVASNKFFSISLALIFLTFGLKSYFLGNKALFLFELLASFAIFYSSISSKQINIILPKDNKILAVLSLVLLSFSGLVFRLFIETNFVVIFPGILGLFLIGYLIFLQLTK